MQPDTEPHPVAGGILLVRTVDNPKAVGGTPEALGYEVWAGPGGVAWVELSTGPSSNTLRLDASTVTALQTVLSAHAPAPTIRSVGVGVGHGTLSMTLRQEWPLLSVTLIAGVLMTTVVLGAVMLRSRRRAALLLALARNDSASREAERTRVAREIHDGPLQDLAVLARQGGPDDQARVREVSADLRALAADLRPPALDQLGLAAALGDLAERWAGAPQPLLVRVSADADRLAPEVELALYRVVQEALANASAHGQARTAWVFLRTLAPERGQPPAAELVVRDDGHGLPPAFATGAAAERRLLADGHFGLVGMAERARALGGALAVRPGPGGAGTEVRIVVPAPRPLRRTLWRPASRAGTPQAARPR